MIKTKQKIFLILTTIVLGIGIAWYMNVYKVRKLDPEERFIASIEPVSFLITRIVGTDFGVTTLLPPGASPETYEPTSKQVLAASDSKAIFTTGLVDFEKSIVAKIKNNSAAEIVTLSGGIELMSGGCSHESTGNYYNHSHGIDPHIWLSPKSLKIMAQNTYEAISKLYPDSTKYEYNYIALLEELDSADSVIRQKISFSDVEYFLIYHPALTYYSADYNIKQVALEQDGKEPSVAYLTPIIDQARHDSIKVILYQAQLNPSIIESIAKDIGARPVEFDPLSADVIDNLLRVTDIITH